MLEEGDTRFEWDPTDDLRFSLDPGGDPRMEMELVWEWDKCLRKFHQEPGGETVCTEASTNSRCDIMVPSCDVIVPSSLNALPLGALGDAIMVTISIPD